MAAGLLTLALTLATTTLPAVGTKPRPSALSHPELPGVPIASSPPSSGRYLGSPMLVRCADGSLLASHDWYGPGSTETRIGQTFLLRSRDHGATWQDLGEIRKLTHPRPDDEGLFWNAMFRRGRDLFSMGPASARGPLVIRLSRNHGASWTEADNTQGRLLPPEDGRPWANGPLVELSSGSFWAVLEHQRSNTWADNRIRVIRAKQNADLLDKTSWQGSNDLLPDRSWLDGRFRGWLEGAPLATRDGGLLATLRVDHRHPNGAGIGGKAALVRIVHHGKDSPRLRFKPGPFDPADPQGSGFIDFPGGGIRFIIRHDPVSDRYWSVCNYIPRKFRNDRHNAERFRGVIALVSSANLADWSVERILMHDPRLYSEDPATVATAFHGPFQGGILHTAFGLQYPWFLIEGNDLLVSVRTAWAGPDGTPPAGHDANHHLFTRVTDFRRRSTAADFRVESIVRERNGSLRVRFHGRPARNYQLQTSSDGRHWTDHGPSMESPGGPTEWHHPTTPAASGQVRVVEQGDSWTDPSR